MTANPYIDPVSNIKFLLQNAHCARTNAPLAVAGYGPLEIITNRITDFNQILENLPALVVDVYSDAVEYYKVDQKTYRLLPLMLVLYIPALARGKPIDQAVQAEIDADVAIKTTFADLESLMASGEAMESIADELIMVGGGGIIPEVLDWEAAMGIKLRVGRLNLVARSLIR